MNLFTLSRFSLFACLMGLVVPSQALVTIYEPQEGDPSWHMSQIINLQTKANAFYAYGLYGQGVNVANIEATHFDSEYVWLSEDLNGNTRFDDLSYRYTGIGALDNVEAHATYVASCIGALAVDDSGNFPYMSLGIAPFANLYSGAISTVVTNEMGEFDISDASVYTTYRHYFSTQKMDVINSSWGGEASADADYMSYFIDALIAESKTTVMVAATGNSGPDVGTVGFPSLAYNAIAVGALDSSAGVGSLADYSSRGAADFYNPLTGETTSAVVAAVDIVAPGSLVIFSYAEDPEKITAASGTSFAAPTVAGGVALLQNAVNELALQHEAFQAASNAIVQKAILLNSAIKTEGWTNNASSQSVEVRSSFYGGYISSNYDNVYLTTQGLDYYVGAGAMNLERSLDTLIFNNNAGWMMGEFTSSTSVYDGSGRMLGYVAAGNTISLTLTWNVDRTLDDSAFATDEAFIAEFGESGENFTFADLNMNDVFFADLCLELWSMTSDGMFDKLIAMSDTKYNNVEHIYFDVEEGNNYAFIVRYLGNAYDFNLSSVESLFFAAAWSIPEPSSTVFILLACVVASSRRRRKIK